MPSDLAFALAFVVAVVVVDDDDDVHSSRGAPPDLAKLVP
jgi:hypothetical protein